MKKDSINDNIIDFNEFVNSDNELSEAMLQAYLEAVDMEIPDLWSKIETGYDREVTEINNEKKSNKKRNKKMIMFIAAVLLITLIVVPVAFLGGDRNTKSDRNVIEEADISYDAMEDACEESACEEAATEAQMAEDIYVESDMDMTEAAAEESEADASSDETPAEGYVGNTNSGGEENVQTLEEVLIEYYDGEYYVYICNSNISLEEGTKIHITNKAVVENIIEENHINIELEYVDVTVKNLKRIEDADKDYTYTGEITDINISK